MSLRILVWIGASALGVRFLGSVQHSDITP